MYMKLGPEFVDGSINPYIIMGWTLRYLQRNGRVCEWQKIKERMQQAPSYTDFCRIATEVTDGQITFTH